MSSETRTANRKPKSQVSNKKNFKRLKTLGAIFTVLGIALFSYFVYTVGIDAVLRGIGKIGFGGFALILLVYLAKLSVRAYAWTLTVYEPYRLDFRETFPAVIIGEALSSIIPLGILVSGTAKAVAVRSRVPLVVGFSSIATENIFYSFVTGLFISIGAFAFLRRFELDPGLIYLIDFIIAFIVFCILLGALMIVRQWHWASSICEWLFNRGILTSILDSGRLQVRLFENFIYGFYRKYPKKFFPLCLLQVLFHTLGVFEVWFILTKIGETIPAFSSAFFLESMSRLITIVFKLIPFLVGVDEAGAEFIVENLAIATGIGVTLAIIRKGRTIFWAAIGMLLIVRRGLSFAEIKEIGEAEKN